MKPILAFIKKNLVALICGVLGILAVVSLYWPTSGFYTDLEAELDKHIAVGTSADGLVKKQRTMPILSPDETNPQPLTVFPTQPVIDAGNAAVAKVSTQATNMMTQAQSANQHQLLVTGELPAPSNDIRYAFAQAYAAEINDYSRWQKILDSTTPPTAEEVTAKLADTHSKILEARVFKDPQTGQPDQASVQEAEAEYATQSAAVKPDMEAWRAAKHRIYLLPGALPVDTTINIQNLPTPDKICDAQFAMWVYDDVCSAIARVNDSDADGATPDGPPIHDIAHSVVKQLVGITTPVPVENTTGFDATAGVSSVAPKVTTISTTGRVSNGLYDVLRFKVSLVCDASKIPLVIRALEAGQFMTVLNVQITEVVDPVIAASGANSTQGGFRFGEKPVVRIELDCEALFMHKWTDPILPDSRKAGLGGVAGSGATPGEGGGGPPSMGGPPGFGGGPPGFGGPPGGFGGPPPGFGGPPGPPR
jgi:hypothetical protein